jgi:hypothetical protein
LAAKSIFSFYSHFESNKNGKNNYWLDKQFYFKKAKPSKGGIFSLKELSYDSGIARIKE